jgi:signal transduction histidine kinase
MTPKDSASPPASGASFAAPGLEPLCAAARMAVVLSDREGRIRWWNGVAAAEFPDLLAEGSGFRDFLERATRPEDERVSPSALNAAAGTAPPSAAPEPAAGQLRWAERAGGRRVRYRYLEIPCAEAGPGSTLHSLTDVSHELELEKSFVHNLRQLQSMKEIVDILYESLSTREVIYLILIAVTSQMGFGFNRAFFCEVGGNRLRGRIGIGPSNAEEAHDIWTRIASLNFSTLREVYEDLTRRGEMPDHRTQEIALQVDIPLGNEAAGEEPAGLLAVLQRGKPARVHASDPGGEVDRGLFSLLATDAIAVVPLSVGGQLRGVILADNFITRKPILDGDLNLLKTFAGYAGVALERSHLYDELRENVAKLQAANESLKANHQKLLQAEKLSAIGKLAAYVSHEIRNPLVAIGGLARSLLKDPIADAETSDTLEVIVAEVNRLEKFLRETLDFVKPRISTATRADLGAVVRDSLATFKNELSEHLIELRTEIPREALEISIDPNLLRHALSNLIKNSIEAMPGGGQLYVELARHGPQARISVGDTGPGIPEEVRPRIFDPFFTTKPGGTGLGLAVASQNIRGLGGRLDLEADERWKTLFRLVLPLDSGAAGGAQEAARAEARGKGKEKTRPGSDRASERKELRMSLPRRLS